MTGPLKQIIALALHAKAVNCGYEPVFNAASTIGGCEYVNFYYIEKYWLGFDPYNQTLVGNDPTEFLHYIKNKGFSQVFLDWRSQATADSRDHVDVAFVGRGGIWRLILVMDNGEKECWEDRWEVGDRQSRTIWQVNYFGHKDLRQYQINVLPLDVAIGQLKTVLSKIYEFSSSHGKLCEPFTHYFYRGLQYITTQQYETPLHHDLFMVPTDDERVCRLLDACQSAWVFGGMGSWNDMSFESEDRVLYNQLSAELYSAIIQGIMSSVNNYNPTNLS